MQKKHAWFNNVLLFVLSLVLVLPLIATLVNSLFRDFTSIIPKGFTFSFYAELFTGENQILPVLLRTVVIAVIPTIILLILLLLAMYAIQVYFPKLDKYLDILSKFLMASKVLFWLSVFYRFTLAEAEFYLIGFCF